MIVGYVLFDGMGLALRCVWYTRVQASVQGVGLIVMVQKMD